jgi:hypothetical protein
LFLIGNRNDGALSWRLDAKIYIASRTKGSLIFPFHACSAKADIGDDRRRIIFDSVSFNPALSPNVAPPPLTNVQISSTDVSISNAGMVIFRAHCTTELQRFGDHIGDAAHIDIYLVQAHDPRPVVFSQTIDSFPDESVPARWGTWKWGKISSPR